MASTDIPELNRYVCVEVDERLPFEYVQSRIPESSLLPCSKTFSGPALPKAYRVAVVDKLKKMPPDEINSQMEHVSFFRLGFKGLGWESVRNGREPDHDILFVRAEDGSGTLDMLRSWFQGCTAEDAQDIAPRVVVAFLKPGEGEAASKMSFVQGSIGIVEVSIHERNTPDALVTWQLAPPIKGHKRHHEEEEEQDETKCAKPSDDKEEENRGESKHAKPVADDTTDTKDAKRQGETAWADVVVVGGNENDTLEMRPNGGFRITFAKRDVVDRASPPVKGIAVETPLEDTDPDAPEVTNVSTQNDNTGSQ
jgi:hypothetical protein